MLKYVKIYFLMLKCFYDSLINKPLIVYFLEVSDQLNTAALAKPVATVSLSNSYLLNVDA